MAKENVNPFQRYLDLGMAFTQMSRKRAQEFVRDLAHEGEVARGQADDWVEELLARSRKTTEHMVDFVREEVKRQVKVLGLVNKDDVADLVQRFADRFQQGAEAATKTAQRAGARVADVAGDAASASKAAASRA